MMEILFRGKRADTGEWVYGDFYHKCGVTGIVYDYMISTRDGMAYPVIPETIGQYTGFKDKNGQEIFDGDTLHSGEVIGNVVYKEGGFVIRRTNGNGEYKMMIARFEVIGNIHDNPELMEVGE